MPTNQVPSAGLNDGTPFGTLYERAVERAAGPEQNSLVAEVRTAVEFGMCDPKDSVEMACTAAETAEALVTALSSPWSLYTPQDAATIASALFVQLQQSADALQTLRRTVGQIAERGETEVPAPAGPGQRANLGDALEALRSVSEQIHGLVARHASTTVRALYTAPSSAPVPADEHETVVAVAALLAKQHDGTVTLNRHHPDEEDHPAPDGGFACACDVTILSADDEYNFHRGGDSQWTVARASEYVRTHNGSAVFDTQEALSTTLKTAHPQQLTDDILRLMTTDRDTPPIVYGELHAVPDDRAVPPEQP
ncbi:hypothetical protein GCM10010232_70070 [Streptomyces amakusaensis]|uniref:Uncharacterized protein n=1 Tax=Streptomyces amakusaensis TaxID=67271 RepID=A0ABW0AW17_9ACTN